ncbi:MAG: oligoribonuclease [Candidatus Saccharibacteria bacterium]|nr:oligoribonuclease [Candidatus Saccharibacteria bacterium]
MKKNNKLPTKLFWVDLEMTGLDPEKDVILEVAAEITDFKFKTLESYEAMVRGGNRKTVVQRMQANTWWADFPGNRDTFVDGLEEATPLGVVEDELIDLLKKHFGNEPAILAGNSIHSDRAFIKKWWPSLDLKLHYRMLDVSSFKVLMQGKYGEEFEKDNPHRAYDDIQASIAELEHYIEFMKTS